MSLFGYEKQIAALRSARFLAVHEYCLRRCALYVLHFIPLAQKLIDCLKN